MSTELDPLLKRLHLANARRVWRDLVARAEKEEWTYDALLHTLFAEEVAHRRGTRLGRAVRAATFPFLRTVEEFDFTYQSTLRLTTIGSLLAPDFVTEGHSVILEGKPGRGKTHLAIAIAYRAVQNGFDALFVTAAELIDDLSAASRDGGLRDALLTYTKPHVLVVDEVGYLAYGDDAANVFFHVVNERHIKRRAMIFTTNKHPKRWGDVLHDADLGEAIVDRILERGRLLRLDGPSVRTRHLANDTTLNDDSDHDLQSARVSGNGAPEFPERTRRHRDAFCGTVQHHRTARDLRRLTSWSTLLLRRQDCRCARRATMVLVEVGAHAAHRGHVVPAWAATMRFAMTTAPVVRRRASVRAAEERAPHELADELVNATETLNAGFTRAEAALRRFGMPGAIEVVYDEEPSDYSDYLAFRKTNAGWQLVHVIVRTMNEHEEVSVTAITSAPRAFRVAAASKLSELSAAIRRTAESEIERLRAAIASVELAIAELEPPPDDDIPF